MPEHFKLWQRCTENDYKSSLREISAIDDVDFSHNTLLCIPGYSSVHDKLREINGYMGVAQDKLGGRETTANIVCVSYPSTEGEATHIDAFNADPKHYSSPGAQEFATKVLLPILNGGNDVNILAKSYGALFYKMGLNELKRLGYSYPPHRIRFIATGPIISATRCRQDEATEIYIDGTNDAKSARLNPFKESPVANQGLVISNLSPHTMSVLTDIPDRVYHWDIAPERFHLKTTSDPDHHTTRMYTTSTYAASSGPLLSNVLRNMLTLKGEKYTLDNAVKHAYPLAPLHCDTGLGEESFGGTTSYHIARAMDRGKKNKEIKAVLFDWDLTLANAEEANRAALNATFKVMQAEGYISDEYKDLDRKKMREVFTGTVPSFFQKIYGVSGQAVVEKAIAEFRKFRAEQRSEIKLLPGAKEIIRQLQKKGVAVGIVSNKDADELRILKDILLPEPEFSKLVVIGNEPGISGKPSPEPIYAAMKMMALPKDRTPSVIFVGDQLHSDVVAAQAAGCRPCLIGDEDKEQLFKKARSFQKREKDDGFAILLNGSRPIIFARDLSTLSRFLDQALELPKKSTPLLH